jgi:hypothetical protein
MKIPPENLKNRRASSESQNNSQFSDEFEIPKGNKLEAHKIYPFVSKPKDKISKTHLESKYFLRSSQSPPDKLETLNLKGGARRDSVDGSLPSEEEYVIGVPSQ